MLQRMRERTARVGVFAVGHDTYWHLFEGLFDNIISYHAVLKRIIEENSVEVFDYGMVDTSLSGYEAADKMKAENLDLVEAVVCNSG